MFALVIQLVFGVRLAEDQIDIITNGVVAISLAILAIAPFFKKKEEDK